MDIALLAKFFFQTYLLFLFNPLFWLVIILVAFQYRRTMHVETQLFGRPKYTLWQHGLVAAAAGLLAGLLASVLLVLTGISLMEIGVQFVWPLALVLLLVNPRYLCFAYAGGIVGVVSSLLQIMSRFFPGILNSPLGALASLHIPGLLALIGILHLTESLLIAVTGHLNPSPLFLRTERGVVGGFSLQKFWPLPIIGLVAAVVPEAEALLAESAAMPDWWPLFASKTVPEAGSVLMYVLMPVVAGLGYGELAVSSTVQDKSRTSAINLGLYSVSLILAAFASLRYPPLTIPAALFAPLAHEFLIITGNKKEFAGEPLYVPPPEGVRILDVFPGTPAEEGGLEPGDVILTVNGMHVYNSTFFRAMLVHSGFFVSMGVRRGNQKMDILLKKTVGNELGVVLVPEPNEPVAMEVKQVNFLQALKERIKKIRGR